MYVCLCKAIPKSEIDTLIQDGAQTSEDIETKCGAGGDCGSCRHRLDKIIQEASEASSVQISKDSI